MEARARKKPRWISAGIELVTFSTSVNHSTNAAKSENEHGRKLYFDIRSFWYLFEASSNGWWQTLDVPFYTLLLFDVLLIFWLFGIADMKNENEFEKIISNKFFFEELLFYEFGISIRMKLNLSSFNVFIGSPVRWKFSQD